MIIQDIPAIPDTIKTAATSGKLIIFVGAGASRILGCPSWIDFAKMHLEAVKASGLINHFVYEHLQEIGEKDPRKLLTICKILLKEPGAQQPDIKKIFEGDATEVGKHKIYEYLYALNAVYITTNFDDHLDHQLELKRLPIDPTPEAGSADPNPQESTKAEVFYEEKDLLASALTNSGNIIHLHGSVKDPDHLIITFPEYAKHYEKGSKATFFLEEVFRRNVLFVGYGVEEYEIMEYILQKASALNGEIRHAMLFPAFEGEEELMDHLDKYYRTLGIELVPYSKTKNGPGQLEEVLRVWSEDIGLIAEPPGFLENIKIIDENI